MRRLMGLLAAAGALAVALAACGGGEEKPTAGTGFGGQKDGFRPAATPTAARPSVADGLRGPAGPAGPAGAPGAFPAPAAPPFATAAPAPTPTPSPRQVSLTGTSGSLEAQVSERKIISTASMTIEVKDVQNSLTQVRAIAEGLGGYVEQLSSSGSDPEKTRGNVTVRVPQEQFFPAIERLEALGKVTNRNLGSQDVSEQYIDLDSRLKSAQREEQSYLGLLARAQNVSEILTLERELNRVRGDIERLQGQLNFLQRRVALATIAVTLTPPVPEPTNPPRGALTMKVEDVSGTAAQVKALVASLKGVLDSSTITVKDGKEEAAMSFRVFAPDFAQALTTIEGKGKVADKSVAEGSGELKKAEKPDAPIQLTLEEREEPWPVWGKVLVIVLPVLAILAIGAFGVWLARRPKRPATP